METIKWFLKGAIHLCFARSARQIVAGAFFRFLAALPMTSFFRFLAALEMTRVTAKNRGVGVFVSAKPTQKLPHLLSLCGIARHFERSEKSFARQFEITPFFNRDLAKGKILCAGYVTEREILFVNN